MRKIYNYAVLIMALFLFGACEGDQGEIGPEGPIGEQGEPGADGADGQDGENGIAFESSGFIKGTLQGTRRDGLAFSEEIEYTRKNVNEGFQRVGDFHTLEISRFLGNNLSYHNSANLKISIIDLYGTPVIKSEFMYLDMEKELGENKLFRLFIDTYRNDFTFTYLIDTDNTDYEFLNGGKNSDYTYVDSKSYRIFDLTNGSKVKYEDAYEGYNDLEGYYYGAFVSLTTADGQVITTGTKYANLELRYDEVLDNTTFFENGVSLGSQKNIPGDTYEISNFNYNAESSIVTFDFVYNFNGGRDNSYNSTNNDLVFTGSVEAQVYSEIMSRTSN